MATNFHDGGVRDLLIEKVLSDSLVLLPLLDSCKLRGGWSRRNGCSRAWLGAVEVAPLVLCLYRRDKALLEDTPVHPAGLELGNIIGEGIDNGIDGRHIVSGPITC